MSRATELFAMRLARRRGETRPDEDPAIADLDRFGESLGIMPGRRASGAGAQPSEPAMPGRPVTSAGDAIPAGDGLASAYPPGGGQQVATRPSTSGIPALDALSERPRRKNRGLMHDRKLGRVLTPG